MPKQPIRGDFLGQIATMSSQPSPKHLAFQTASDFATPRLCRNIDNKFARIALAVLRHAVISTATPVRLDGLVRTVFRVPGARLSGRFACPGSRFAEAERIAVKPGDEVPATVWVLRARC